MPSSEAPARAAAAVAGLVAVAMGLAQSWTMVFILPLAFLIGLGLGLAVSFGIIRRHGGNIEVESEYGKGTEFRITLPVARMGEKSFKQVEQIETVEALVPAVSLNVPAVQSMETPRMRMLVVDDEDFVRELIGEILEGEHCDVYLADNGR